MTSLILIWLSAGAMFLGFAIGSFAGWMHERRSENNRRKREAQRLANDDFGKHLRGATDSLKHGSGYDITENNLKGAVITRIPGRTSDSLD